MYDWSWTERFSVEIKIRINQDVDSGWEKELSLVEDTRILEYDIMCFSEYINQMRTLSSRIPVRLCSLGFGCLALDSATSALSLAWCRFTHGTSGHSGIYYLTLGIPLTAPVLPANLWQWTIESGKRTKEKETDERNLGLGITELIVRNYVNSFNVMNFLQGWHNLVA